MDDERVWLKTLMAENNMNYKELSLAIGRNPTYIQQYFTKDIPKILPDDIKQKIKDILPHASTPSLINTQQKAKKDKFIIVMSVVEDFLKERRKTLNPSEKAELIYALIDIYDDFPKEEAEAKIIEFSNFYLKTKSA